MQLHLSQMIPKSFKHCFNQLCALTVTNTLSVFSFSALFEGTNQCLLFQRQCHVCLFTWKHLFTFARLYRFSLINFTFWCLTLFSKFYFNFPSQYLFAIGLTIIFSVRCTFTTCHTFHTTIPSWTTLKKQTNEYNKLCVDVRDFHSLWCCFPTNFIYTQQLTCLCFP